MVVLALPHPLYPTLPACNGIKSDSLSYIVSNSPSFTETLTVKLTIGGFDEPRQAIKYSTNDGQAYVLNKDLSISLIDYIQGSILKNIK